MIVNSKSNVTGREGRTGWLVLFWSPSPTQRLDTIPCGGEWYSTGFNICPEPTGPVLGFKIWKEWQLKHSVRERSLWLTTILANKQWTQRVWIKSSTRVNGAAPRGKGHTSSPGSAMLPWKNSLMLHSCHCPYSISYNLSRSSAGLTMAYHTVIYVVSCLSHSLKTHRSEH